MEKKIIEFNKSQRALKSEQEFHSGDVVKVFLRIKEGAKERTQIFEGLVIAVKGGQSSSPTITVRKVTHDVGVEMIVPVGSKNVEKIELVKRAKVRRAKLYYIRTLTTKQSRMKYKDIKDVNKKDKPKVETVKAEVASEKVEEKAVEKVEEKKAE
ncbi:MAG: 50S ribosomal protein L19 [Parcubacteria group bacterium]|jgi:large subunit ribosomal protein L19